MPKPRLQANQRAAAVRETSGGENAAPSARAGCLKRWAQRGSAITEHLRVRTRQCLAAYRENPLLVTEHANIERATAQGGYGRRQIYELVQNAADAILGSEGGRVHVILTEDGLYCANDGEPVGIGGIDAIMSSHISMKRGSEIGRFGLGFKSVLGVTTSPEVYSRSGSFGFNAQEAARVIRGVVPDAERLPILRIAHPLDPVEAAGQDGCLADLMSWAVSVAKLPRNLEETDWLGEDIDSFPAEFLLFCPHVGRLILEDRTRSVRREIRVRQNGDRISLEEGEDAGIWKVFSVRHVPSEAARKDAGELADRESLPLMWAVPLHGRAARGRFWAFFPTEYFTTLSGIVNAPWKTNEDRQNLLTGPFNAELIARAARLVASHIGDLVTPRDPGRFLDLLPARGREAPNWADEKLTEMVYEAAAVERSIPDQKARLCLPSSLHLHPANLPREALEAWAAFAGRSQDWCHHSVETRERRSRVERLLALAGRSPATLTAWLEAVATAPTPEASLAALGTAAKLVAALPPSERWQIENAHILLADTGVLVQPRPDVVFIAGEDTGPVPNVQLVHSAVAAHPAGRGALAALGIREVDASSELQSLLARLPLDRMRDSDWPRVWRLVRRIPVDRAVELLAAGGADTMRSRIHVRTLAGEYRPLTRTLLPGQVVPEDGSRDRAVAVDAAFHAEEMPVLRALGAASVPVPGGSHYTERWFGGYRREAVQAFLRHLTRQRARPQDGYLVFDKTVAVGPLDPLVDLSEEGKARFTESLLLAGADEGHWTMSHASRRDQYPTLDMPPPHLWMARREGRLRTSLGVRRVGECVGPGLRGWAAVLPVADCTEEASRQLELPGTLDDLPPEAWQQAFAQAERLEDDRLIGAFYAAAARFVGAPVVLRCCEGPARALRKPKAVTAVVEESVREAVRFLGKPFLLVSSHDDARSLVERWGLLPIDSSVSIEVRGVPSGPETPLLDRFGGLSMRLTEEQGALRLVPCSSLRLETVTAAGKRGEDRDILREGSVVYFADRLSNGDLLDRLMAVVGIVLTPDERQGVLDHRALVERRERFYAVRRKTTPALKLLEAVGVEAIRRRLPAGLTAALDEGKAPPDKRIGELALAVYGVETLHVFRDELHRVGLEPPIQWAGSHAARTFVQGLGFTKEYAGFQQARRDAVLEVEGPPDLPPLHEFQEEIVTRIRRLLTGKSRRRGLLSLPTGAGKTRVAVEALVRAVREAGFPGPFLWIAQSDELCEQAVQTWSEVWRAIGPRQPLQINRLWASNEADSLGDGAQVVVATIQKLQGCIDDAAYAWLAEATCVLIDEAHSSITPAYTAVLAWLGLGRGNDRCPLIGLTATPFRGGEEETKRLVNRYGARLDAGVLGDDPYARLQEMQVLAQVDHELLEGATVRLSDAELEALTRLRLLPTAAGDRLGADVPRNEVLLRSIRRLPKDWPVLLFAVSVDHARTIAALLTAAGISAAAISAETEPGARRHYIEQFRSGKLRALTNYGVLTAGFDAPAVRAVYVARPTFSPGLYQQMIGRGLRGPLNGGKDRCLIVNVKDNIVQFGEELAFRKFEHLWSRE